MVTKYRFSGCYGFIAIPDPTTVEVASRLTEEAAPHAHFKMNESIHLALHYVEIEEASPDFVRHCLKRLSELLKGTKLLLGEVGVFADHYLHWNLECDQEILTKAHYFSLATLDIFRVDKFNHPPFLVNGTLNLTQLERTNLERYGHPLVLGQFRQCLTLASHPEGLESKPQVRRHVGYIADVQFAHFGPWGQVLKNLR